MSTIRIFFTLSIFIGLVHPAWSKLEFQGNKKTNSKTLIKMIGSETTTPAFIEQKLMNTGLFVSVKATEQDQYTLVEVEEKWTTIPILKINTTGSQRQIVTGLYDPNLFGSGLELGGQYENLVGRHSGVAWFKDRFSGSGIELWQVSRLREKFDQKAIEPVLLRSFIQQQSRVSLTSSLHFSEKLNTKFKVEFQKDRFTKSEESTPPERSDFGLAHVEFQSKSQDLSLFLTHAQGLNASSYNFQSVKFKFTHSYYFKSLFELTGRIESGVTNAKNIQFWFYHGGLESIRGYRDNRFQGRSFWLVNQELRATVYQGRFVNWQTVFFTDMLSRAEKTSDFLSLDGVATGLGLRLIVPKIYRFVLRLDYAKTWKTADNQDLSFGVQHFF